ncbi:MAG: hypothetical protein KF878_10855 [Planctomycetes bacterium]|nr:hypothetical protein [Planctomycetota bacterium]
MGASQLSGLDGSNLLAFLAALGTLRVLDGVWPERDVRLCWEERGFWTPVLTFNGEATREELVVALDEALRVSRPGAETPKGRKRSSKEGASNPDPDRIRRDAKAILKKAKKEAKDEAGRLGLRGQARKDFEEARIAEVREAADRADAAAREALTASGGLPQYSLDDVIGVPGPLFRRFALRARFAAQDGWAKGPPRLADWSGFVVAFGSEAVLDKDCRVQPTPLSFLNGAGGKCLLKTCRELAAVTTAEHLSRSLFETWSYQDEQLALRWDPADDRRYALRWGDPGKDTAGTEWGASRLAIEALPLLPTAPAGPKELKALGWRRGSDGFELTWPIWDSPLALPTVASLLGLATLGRERPDRSTLRAMGVVEILRARRTLVGKNVFVSVAVPAPGR